MSDTVAKLTDEQNKRFKVWFEKKLQGDLICPLCKEDNWKLLNHLISTPIYSGGPIKLGGETYAYVSIYCENCGHTKLFNAVISGIIKEAE